MKRLLFLIPLLALCVAFAQHEGGHQAAPAGGPAARAASGHEGGEASGEHGGGSMTGWKWANFVLLAGGLGYLIAKKAPAFFAGRTNEIRKGIEEAARLKAEADARAAEIEMRLAGIAQAMEALQAAAKAELEAEERRLRAETQAQLAKIQARSEQELASAVKSARQELKAHAAELAVQLAEKQLRARMTAEAERELISGFVRDLEKESRTSEGVN